MGWFFIALLLILTLVYEIPRVTERRKSHNTYSKGILNHDYEMKNFCYRVNMRREEILDALEVRNFHHLSYEFDRTSQIIHFGPRGTELNPAHDYELLITELPEYTHLRVKQLNHFDDRRNNYPWKQNEFWFKKLGAEPIYYTKEALQ